MIFIGAGCFSDSVPDCVCYFKGYFYIRTFNSFMMARIYFREYVNVALFSFTLLSCLFVLFDYMLMLFVLIVSVVIDNVYDGV
jgi:hypothetical protein